jgi:dTDP-4-amino-4,6-dideoxygalactose transaminase
MTTDDEELYPRLKRLRVHGDVGYYEHIEVGMNSRLDALQAAVLRVKLQHLDSWTVARQKNARRYREMFSAEGLSDSLIEPIVAPERRHVFNQYCVVVRDGQRDHVQAEMKARKLGCAVYYPKPLHLQKCFAELGYKMGDFPMAEATAGNILALPIYPELPAADQERVVAGLAEICHGSAKSKQVRRAA